MLLVLLSARADAQRPNQVTAKPLSPLVHRSQMNLLYVQYVCTYVLDTTYARILYLQITNRNPSTQNVTREFSGVIIISLYHHQRREPVNFNASKRIRLSHRTEIQPDTATLLHDTTASMYMITLKHINIHRSIARSICAHAHNAQIYKYTV